MPPTQKTAAEVLNVAAGKTTTAAAVTHLPGMRTRSRGGQKNENEQQEGETQQQMNK